ncbi:MAG TPA: hypothetical protein VF701_11860 [Thermoanaerobaculia bacterium]
MDQHIRIIAVLYIVLGILGMIGAVVVLTIGAGTVATILAENQDPDSQIGAAWAGGCMTFVAALIGIISLPSIIAGWGLWRRKSWARILTMILAVLHLPGFPLGTAIGIYALVIMLNDETRVLLNE